MIKSKKISQKDVAQALTNDEFVFYYQPIISLVTGKVCSAEALIRWIRPDGSLILPSLFIPLTEETGFVTKITQAMLPKLMADIIAIQQADSSLTIAFNLSAQDIIKKKLIDNLLLSIQENQIDARKFQVEITERQMLTLNVERQKAILALDTAGIQIALDDFCMGYSAIALVRDLPISVLKIDQSLVSQIFELESCAQIVRHSISLAHQLTIQTIGEGVESKEVLDFLLCFGCDDAQGYYFSPPLPLSNFLAFLSSSRRWAVAPLGLIHLASQDHMDWRRDFIREIMSLISTQDEKLKQKSYERMPNTDPRKCLLGQWYYGAGQDYQNMSLFEQIGIKHEKLHQTAQLLVDSVRSNTSSEQIVKLIWLMNKQSGELQKRLQDFHTYITLWYKKLAPNE